MQTHSLKAAERPPATVPPTPIAVAMVEDDVDMRLRLATAIEADTGLALAFAAACAADLMAWLPKGKVDVLLVDLGLPDGSGVELIRRCRVLQPACEILVITIYGDESTMRAALEAGASGYLLKDGSAMDLAAAVRQLLIGGSPMSPLIARQLLTDWRSTRSSESGAPPGAASSHRPAPLSARENQVLDRIARGYSYGEIARHLGLTVSTVQSHVRNIYSKMEVHSKTEAVYEARQLGWLR